jgi:hypothetical protein
VTNDTPLSFELPPDTPAAVAELVRACAAFVRKSVGVELDLSPDTLPLLDHYLAEARASHDEVRALVAAAAGAYFGELVRAQLPCRWSIDSKDDHDAWRLEFDQVFLYFYPVALARAALERAAPDEVTSLRATDAGFTVRDQDRPALAAALDALGSVDEDEFYLLSTRFDVLSSIAERLTAIRQRELGVEELPAIGAEVYAKAIPPDPASN